MRKMLSYNYWLIIISWCCFLNNLSVLAIIFSLCACALLISVKWRINCWRMCFVCVLSYLIIYAVLFCSTIPFFFSKLYIFLAIICINLAFTNERLYLLKSKYLNSYFVIMLFCFLVSLIISLLLKDDLYSIFTKKNLYILICLVFLPYLVPMVICLTYKKVLSNKKRCLSKTYHKHLLKVD